MPISIKSAREIEFMTEAGRILEIVHKEMEKALRPGMTTRDIDRLGEEVIRSYGCVPSFLNYNGFPATACISINDEVIHGIPSKKRIIKEGDIVSIDLGAILDGYNGDIYKGYHSDAARTYAIGEVDQKVKDLIRVTEESFFEGLKYARPGNRLSDISHAIEEYAKKFNYGVVRDFTGHGIGSHLHEDPAIPNYGEAGHGPILRKGMTLAIEPMINLGTYRVKILNDGWTTITCDKLASAHYENSIVITDNGYEILTKIKEND